VLIAVLSLAQAALGIARSVGWFQIGSDLMGQGVLLLPISFIIYVRGALVAGLALLYALFAWGILSGRPWARSVGFVAAAVTLLLVLSVVIQGDVILRVLLWCIVPVVIIGYLLAEPNR